MLPQSQKTWLTRRSNRLFGFLLGSTLAGFGMYYYVVDEYKVSNELLVEDIYVSRERLVHLERWRRRLCAQLGISSVPDAELDMEKK